MRPAVGLQVQPLDLHHPHLGDVRRQQVDLGADEIGNQEGLLTGKNPHTDWMGGGDLDVDLLLNLVDQLPPHMLELEVHPSPQRLHVAAGHRCAIVPPDDAAEDVHRRVSAHQRVAALPVNDAPDTHAHRRRIVVQFVHDTALAAADLHHLPLAAIGQQPPDVARLPSAANIEGGPIQHHPIAGNLSHVGLELAQVTIRLVKQLGHSASRSHHTKDSRPKGRESHSRGTTLLAPPQRSLLSGDQHHRVLLTGNESV